MITRKFASFIRLSRPILLVGGIVMCALGALVALALFFVPIALVAIVLARQAVGGRKVRYSRLTFSAVSLHTITALLETVGILLSA